MIKASEMLGQVVGYHPEMILAGRRLNDAIVLAVAHREFRELGAEGIRAWGKPEHVLYDLKYLLPKESVDLRL
ncbi:MAG: hypothetical protein U5L98_04925 [Halomonas sp.]|uniref:hypothetical protein n=1 Tax=Halomonas sp. TaxID=1486246 RepID=UPI002ACD88D5|nr:hypothetical protein [Halomonas sp.]MDZ7851996.1 hypothetical protein [Halomonas sp.]